MQYLINIVNIQALTKKLGHIGMSGAQIKAYIIMRSVMKGGSIYDYETRI